MLKTTMIAAGFASAMVLAMGAGTAAVAYDGTKCKAPGNCWEPKPNFPDKVAGSKYDPKHDLKELNKQTDSWAGQNERNKKRAEHFKKTGKWVYDVSKL